MEMDSSDAIQHSSELSEYVLSASFPECVCVTHGKHITKSVQITQGDVVVLKSCESPVITLTYKDEESGRRKNIDVSIDCPQKYVVLPPKEFASSRAVSVIMYPSISDLLIDSPTYFEATSSYNDTNLNGTSITRGDKFRFRGVSVSPGDSQKRLKTLDKDDIVVFLSLDCKGNFYPLEDDQCYTLKELTSFAPVPRRLKLIQHEEIIQHTPHTCLVKSRNLSQDGPFEDELTTSHNSSSSSCLSNLSKPSNSSLPCSVLLSSSINGVVHMLKPNVSVTVSPTNDPDTLWTIPVTANIHVQEFFMDDYEYEVPSAIIAKNSSKTLPFPIDNVEEIPDFPAPSTPPLAQPLVPVKVNHFLNIYSNSFPLRAKIMDTSDCNTFYATALSGCDEIIIHRVENTQRLYAKDLKTDSVYSLSNKAKVSFIEYPQKFNSISELVDLAVGSELVILEDIASDFPKAFSLQFGDVIRITSNNPIVMKVKHTDLECKILKCERVNPDNKNSTTKLKLPLDFEVKMIISTDHADKKVISMQEILSGRILPPLEDVATLIDDGQDNELKDLPPNLQKLEILSEKLLMVSLPDILHNNELDGPQNEFLGIPVTSGLVLAFRQRLDPSERVCLLPQEVYFTRQSLEVLSVADFEERKQQSKLQTEEDAQEIESVSSGDKYSTSGDSLQRKNSTGFMETKKRKKENDRMRRLSRVLNPKHWRASKAAPEPLPHPEAMGLMALAARPHYEKSNDYEISDEPSPAPSVMLDQTLSSVGASSDEGEEEHNIYEDVDIGPLRKSSSKPQSKSFSGPFHKSLPMPRIFSQAREARRAKKKALLSKARAHPHGDEPDHSFIVNDLYKSSSAQPDSGENGNRPIPSEFEDDEHVYDSPEGALTLIKQSSTDSQMHDGVPKPNARRTHSLDLSAKSHYVTPTAKPRSTDKTSAVKVDVSEAQEDCLRSSEPNCHSGAFPWPSVNEKQISKDPPVPPRRTKKIEISSKESAAMENNAPADTTASSEVPTISRVDSNKENSSKKEECNDNGDKRSISDGLKPPVPKPRRIKNSSHFNSVNVDNGLERDVQVLSLTAQKTIDNDSGGSGHLCAPKNSENEIEKLPLPKSPPVKTVRDGVRPKPPPPPKPKPKLKP